MRRFFPLLLMVVLCLTGCQPKGYLSRDMYAMNTVISVNIPADVKGADALMEEAQLLIDGLEAKLSATREQSEISTGEYSDETLSVLDYAYEISRNTGGAYDPECLALTRLWRINDGGYIPDEEEISAALEKNDIDLGGIAKGYALQKTVELLSEKAEYGMVSFGGNVGVWGNKPDGTDWTVGIKDPYDTSSVVGKVILSDGGYIAVSGDYERYFEQDGIRYHHIFDPETGYPVYNGTHSTAVYTKDGALGDALSTALFVMGYDKAIELYNSGIYEFEALFVTDEGVFMTKGMEEMFINEN